MRNPEKGNRALIRHRLQEQQKLTAIAATLATMIPVAGFVVIDMIFKTGVFAWV